MSPGQQKTNKFSQLFARIEAVRIALDLKWDELAQRMDVNRSLFFQVKRAADGKKGGCGLSDRNLARLQALELEAGIRKPEVQEQPHKTTYLHPHTLTIREQVHGTSFAEPKTTHKPDPLLMELSHVASELEHVSLELRKLTTRFEMIEARLRERNESKAEGNYEQ